MMKVWGMTDIGLVRKENQDAYAVRVNESTGHLVAVVCDGMGGPKGGRLASTIAVETFLSSCMGNLMGGMDPGEVVRAARFAVGAANSGIFRKSLEDPKLRGMGTTLVSAVVWENRALLCNVGDSRAYLLTEGGGLRQVTRDHSLVEQMVEMGTISPEQARTHPNRNIITRALGPDEHVECDCFPLELHAGDCLLLCTDGLVGPVTDRELERELRRSDRNGCLTRLLAMVKSQGAHDNVTAVLLEQM